MTQNDVAAKIVKGASNGQLARIIWWHLRFSKKADLLKFLIMVGHDFDKAYPVAKKFKYHGK